MLRGCVKVDTGKYKKGELVRGTSAKMTDDGKMMLYVNVDTETLRMIASPTWIEVDIFSVKDEYD